jgi:hypothetical protein
MPDQYKLYAVGTTNPDPDKWSWWSEVSLVCARNEAEAIAIGGDAVCVEVILDRPMILMSEHEPNWGRDL